MQRACDEDDLQGDTEEGCITCRNSASGDGAKESSSRSGRRRYGRRSTTSAEAELELTERRPESSHDDAGALRGKQTAVPTSPSARLQQAVGSLSGKILTVDMRISHDETATAVKRTGSSNRARSKEVSPERCDRWESQSASGHESLLVCLSQEQSLLRRCDWTKELLSNDSMLF